MFGTLISPVYTPSLEGSILAYTSSQGINREKYKLKHESMKCRLLREINTFPAIHSLIGRFLFVF